MSPISKISGLGDNFYVGGYDLSGDIASLEGVAQPLTLLDVTGINKSAHERIPGLADGSMSFTTYFNPTTGQEHKVFSTLPTTDVQFMYAMAAGGMAIGNPGAALIAKQADYAPTRGADGSLTTKVSAQANGFGLEWGNLLTAGIRTDTAATAGTAYDFGAANSFGFQAYLQVTAFTGTDITIKIQDSADNVTFADLASGAFAQTTAAHTTQRIAVGGTATVRRYVKVTTVTSGGFTSCSFAVVFVDNVTKTAF